MKTIQLAVHNISCLNLIGMRCIEGYILMLASKYETKCCVILEAQGSLPFIEVIRATIECGEHAVRVECLRVPTHPRRGDYGLSHANKQSTAPLYHIMDLMTKWFNIPAGHGT